MKNIKRIWCNEGEEPSPERIIKIDASALSNLNQQDDSSIKTIDNTIFFYSDVSSVAAIEVNKLLTELEVKLLNLKNNLGDDYSPSIKLRINSGGGSLMDGLAILDCIRSMRVPVHTYIDGAAASAATIISIAGKKRFIGKNSFMLIHQLSGGYFGTFHQLEDEHNNSKRLMSLMKDIYKEYTKIPIKKLEEILKHDLWFNAKECLEYGLVDHII